MRNTIQNVGLLVIVGTLSAVFLLQFGGPQAQGCAADVGASYAARVYDDTITVGELKAAYTMANGSRYSTAVARQMKLKEGVLDGLVDRALLAREARNLGFEVEADEVMTKLAEEGIIYVTAPVGGPAMLPSGPQMMNFADENGVFDPDNARRFIQHRLGRSVEDFVASQREEALAQRMREVIAATVVVSPNEVWDAFVRERDKVEIEYVKFDRAYYRGQVSLSDAKIDAWTREHQAEIDAEYEREKHRYTGLEKQVRARHVLIKVPADADEAAKAAARARAEKVRARAQRGEDFANLARELSEDQGSAKLGGDLGYNVKGKMVAAFDDAQFALAPGQLSEVVETRFGFHVIKVEGVREGDVPVAEAKREIARERAEADAALELAKSAADGVHSALSKGTDMDTLAEQLERAKASDGDAPLAPVVQNSRPFGRGDTPIPGVDAPELAARAFELSEEAPLCEAPVAIDDGFVVFRLIKHAVATKEDFEAEGRERLSQALLARKRAEAVERHVLELRHHAETEGAVHRSPAAVSYSASES